jgi:hypothetical protein
MNQYLPQLGLPNPVWSFLLALAAAVAMSAVLQAHVDAQPRDRLEWRDAPNALSLDMRVDAEGQTATFVWSLETDRDHVSCALDANGDGEIDYRVPDCRARNELTHRFEDGETGVVFPTLIAESADGRAGIARARVDVL